MLGELITKIKDDTLSSKTAKTLFESLWNKPGDPIERIKSLGLEQIDDSNALEAIVNTVIKQNSDQVEQLKWENKGIRIFGRTNHERDQW